MGLKEHFVKRAAAWDDLISDLTSSASDPSVSGRIMDAKNVIEANPQMSHESLYAHLRNGIGLPKNYVDRLMAGRAQRAIDSGEAAEMLSLVKTTNDWEKQNWLSRVYNMSDDQIGKVIGRPAAAAPHVPSVVSKPQPRSFLGLLGKAFARAR